MSHKSGSFLLGPTSFRVDTVMLYNAPEGTLSRVYAGMQCLVPPAQWCWYYHEHNTPGGIQSVEQQLEWEEGAVEEII